MVVKLLTEHHLEFLSVKGGCRGSSESTLVKMSNCWKSHAAAQMLAGIELVLSNLWYCKRFFHCWKLSRNTENGIYPPILFLFVSHYDKPNKKTNKKTTTTVNGSIDCFSFTEANTCINFVSIKCTSPCKVSSICFYKQQGKTSVLLLLFPCLFVVQCFVSFLFWAIISLGTRELFFYCVLMSLGC